MKRTRMVGLTLLTTAALTLAGCADGTEGTGATETPTEAATTDEAISLEEGVVRATEEDNPMTSVFGTLHNQSDEEVSIVALTADVEAGSYEIHEVVNGVMQEKEGGITIPAGESHELAPGGDHFMLMDLAAPIEAGDTVVLVLELDDGSTVELEEVPVRTMGAGSEDYGDLEHMDHSDHSDHDH